jgi:hypothetical protein
VTIRWTSAKPSRWRKRSLLRWRRKMISEVSASRTRTERSPPGRRRGVVRSQAAVACLQGMPIFRGS